LKASARTRSPDGRDWEIYAYRARVDVEPGAFRRIRRLFAPREKNWTVEAVSWAPYPIRHRWAVEADRKGQVLLERSRHRLAHRRAHVHAQALLEAVPLAAPLALVEMMLGLAHLLFT